MLKDGVNGWMDFRAILLFFHLMEITPMLLVLLMMR